MPPTVIQEIQWLMLAGVIGYGKAAQAVLDACSSDQPRDQRAQLLDQAENELGCLHARFKAAIDNVRSTVGDESSDGLIVS